MPFILEAFWIIFILIRAAITAIAIKKEKFSDPQLRAITEFGGVYMLLKEGNNEAALTQMNQVIAEGCQHMDMAYLMRAKAYLAMHQPERALADVYRALDVNLFLSEAYLEKARAYLQLKEPRKAATALEYTTRLNPHHPDIYEIRGQIQWMRGQTKEAQESWARAGALAGQHR